MSRSFLPVAALTWSLLIITVSAQILSISPILARAYSLDEDLLVSNGSEFPCQQDSGVYNISTMDNISVGVSQRVTLEGGATRGDGSCQVSITIDKQPTKNSDWKVIHNTSEGCLKPHDGSLDTPASYVDNPSFEYTMPEGIADGEYTLAWTWLSATGDRELYIVCAPITVTGGTDNNEVYNSLPDMVVNTIPHERRTTKADEEFATPVPSLYVGTNRNTIVRSKRSGIGPAFVTAEGQGTGKLAKTTEFAKVEFLPGSNGSDGTNTTPSYSPINAARAAVVPSSAVDAATTTETANRVATITTLVTIIANSSSAPPQVTPVASSSAARPASAHFSNVTSNISPVSTSSPYSSVTCPNRYVPCNNEGVIICIGSTQWGTCNAGCAVPMQLAVGTACYDGIISKRSVPEAAPASPQNGPRVNGTYRRHTILAHFERDF